MTDTTISTTKIISKDPTVKDLVKEKWQAAIDNEEYLFPVKIIKKDTNGDDQYRYIKVRSWDRGDYGKGKGQLGYLMFHPSKSTDDINDQTLKRCIIIAQVLGFDSIAVVNLFAHKEGNALNFWKKIDKKGASVKDFISKFDEHGNNINDKYIKAWVATVDAIACTWGRHGAHPHGRGRRADVVKLILEELGALNKSKKLYRLNTTLVGDGKQPGHPGNLDLNPFDLELIEWDATSSELAQQHQEETKIDKKENESLNKVKSDKIIEADSKGDKGEN